MLSFVPNGPPGVISSRGGRIGPSPVLGAKFDPGTDRVNDLTVYLVVFLLKIISP